MPDLKTEYPLVRHISSVTRDRTQLMLDGQRWTMCGANVYWLGLDENVIPVGGQPPNAPLKPSRLTLAGNENVACVAGQPFYGPTNASYPSLSRITEIMQTLSIMGARTIRSQTLGVSVGNPLSMMPSLGVYNEEAFNTMDWAIFQAREYGLRVFAPLVDNYDYYHGGKFDFLRFRGIDLPSKSHFEVDSRVMEFYTNPTVVQDFKDYIQHLLTHRNRYTGLTYAEDPTIFAYETGNELGGPIFMDQEVPMEWTKEISEFIKKLAPNKLVIDGTYGIKKENLLIDSIDIYDDHFYEDHFNMKRISDGVSLVAASKKVYIAGEYDWRPTKPGPSLVDFYSFIEEQQKREDSVVAGDLFWSLFGHDLPDHSRFVNHLDGFTLHYNNPADPPEVRAQVGRIRKHFFAMKGEVVEADSPPAKF